jgi:small subunit ribosomal protein S2
MITLKHQDLLKAGVHLGHLSKKWHPNMAPFIFMVRHGVHIIDLNKTLVQLQEATNTLQEIARSGKKILFVATKKQAKEIVEAEAKRLGMLYMTERWLGGTLTNFVTIRRLIKKLLSMERMAKSDAYKNMAKKEQLMLDRDKNKLERVLKGIMDLTKPPGALVVVDINKEHIAVKEANKLGIPVIALTDTNSNPDLVDYPIPSNDDAYPAISLLVKTLSSAIEAGLAMREQDREIEAAQDKEAEANKPTRPRKVEKVISTSNLADNSSAKSLKSAKPLATKVVKRGQGPISISQEGNVPRTGKATAATTESKPTPVAGESKDTSVTKESKDTPQTQAKPNAREEGLLKPLKGTSSKEETKESQPRKATETADQTK